MDPRSPSFEASLLYRTAMLPDADNVLVDLPDIIEANGETLLRTDKVDDLFTILTCETVQVLLAFLPDPLPVEHFLNASRPGAASLSETEILARLQQISGMVTVLVLERDLAEHPATARLPQLKHDLCWDITECLFQNSRADIVFWSESDMLFAAEEFERSCNYRAAQPEALPSPEAEPGSELETETDAAPEPMNLPALIETPAQSNIPAIFESEPQVDMAILASLEPRKDEAEDENAAEDTVDAQPEAPETGHIARKRFLGMLPVSLGPIAKGFRRGLRVVGGKKDAA